MKINENYNLLKIYPELVKEWNYEKNGNLNPKNVYPNSCKKVWWKCKKGHEWEASVSHRAKGKGCPYCSNQKVCNNNCLSTLNPELAKEWNYEKNGNLTPNDIVPNSNKKVWWICEKGHSWKAIVSSRNKGHNCPYCCNRKVCNDNCLETLNPKLAEEWNYEKNGDLTPKMVGICSSKKVWWKCKKGHEWKTHIASRRHGSRCPYCSNQKVCDDNCLAITHPKLIKEWDFEKNKNLTPYNVIAGSGKKVWWICEKGHSWEARISHRTSNVGCPYCVNMKICNDNCLATLSPELTKEWNYEKNGNLTPYDVGLNGYKKVWWVCENGHSWKATPHSRNQGGKCRYCSKRVSKACSLWLNSLNINIREKFISIDNKIFYVDGFDPNSNIIYEFLGDYWHGNPTKYNPKSINSKTNSKFIDLLIKTINRFNIFFNNGYNIIYKWECLNKNFQYKPIELNYNVILKHSCDFFNKKEEKNIFEKFLYIT